MADLIGRNLDDRISQALKARAARPERCAETGDRALMQQALRPRPKGLAQALASMPKANPHEIAGIGPVDVRSGADCPPESGQRADISVHWLPHCP